MYFKNGAHSLVYFLAAAWSNHLETLVAWWWSTRREATRPCGVLLKTWSCPKTSKQPLRLFPRTVVAYLTFFSLGYVIREGGHAPKRPPQGLALDLIMPDTVVLEPQTVVSLDMSLLIHMPLNTVGLVSLRNTVARKNPHLRLITNIIGKHI